MTETKYMFYHCEKLKKLNLSNFYCPKVSDIFYMFSGCKDLTSLDLSNFNPSSTIKTNYMFNNCENLLFLNLSNWKTSSSDMGNMFSNCTKLKTLDISNIITSSTGTMQSMFSGCENLVSLDLSNFDCSSVSRIDNMFKNCKSLIYLNLNSFEITTKMKKTNDAFKGISNNAKICYNEVKFDLLKDIALSQCEDFCFHKNTKLLVENETCFESCRETNFKYEFNHICYETCPLYTHKSSTDEYICEEDLMCKYTNMDRTECYDAIIEGYYLKDPNQNILDKCHDDCKSCDKKESIDSTNCLSCHDGKYLNFGNCVESCKYGYDNNNICKCSLNDKCKECNKDSYNLDLCISCNDGFYTIYSERGKNYNFFDCNNNTDGYYLDLDIKAYKPCYEKCKNCYGEGNSVNNNCSECFQNYEFKSEFGNNNNCFEICTYYYYFDENNNYQCTTSEKCPEKKNKLITEKRKCIEECKKDNIYKNEYNNKCYKTCPNETYENNNICIPNPYNHPKNESLLNCSTKDLFIKKSCGTEITNTQNQDKLIESIQNAFINEKKDKQTIIYEEKINNSSNSGKKLIPFKNKEIFNTNKENISANIINSFSFSYTKFEISIVYITIIISIFSFSMK